MKKVLLFLTLTVVILTCLVACNSKDEHSHVFGVWSDIQTATCTEDGMKARYCYCGEKQTEIVSRSNHTIQVSAGKEATCTENGLTDGKVCTDCGEVISVQEEIPSKGHTEEILQAVESTCTEKGLTEGLRCSDCGETLVAQQETPLKAHTEVIDKAVEASCTKTGLSEGKHCSVCSIVLVVQQTTPIISHAEGDWIVDEAASANDDGKKTHRMYYVR